MGFPLSGRASQPQGERRHSGGVPHQVGGDEGRLEELRAKVNRETRSPRTIGELVEHYREKELMEDSRKSFSTRQGIRELFA